MTNDQNRLPRRPEEVGDDFVIVGQIVGAVGLQGAVRVRLDTDFPERLVRGRQLFVGNQRYTLLNARISGTTATLRLDGVEDRTSAESLRGALLLAQKAELPPLPDGEFYVHQLIGLRVQTPTGAPLGTLTDVLFTGANDVYVVGTPTGPLYLPALDDVILDVDLEAGVMIAEPLEGSIPAPPRPRRHRARTRGRRRDNRGRAGPRSDVPSQVTER